MLRAAGASIRKRRGGAPHVSPLKEQRMTRFLVAAFSLLGLLAGPLSAGGELSLTSKNTTITFVGTKPGGKHDGGFKELTGSAACDGKDPTSLKITVEIDMNTLYSDNNKLTNHLKSPDFFGVKSNPKAKFVSTKVEKAGDEYKITGELTMCGKTNALTFPARITLNDGDVTIASNFKLDRTQWGMTYGRGKINDEVALTVKVNAKK
jgi:polyisoprenoid-binding protein YceI